MGEYYVLQQGEAFVLNTMPRFKLHVKPADTFEMKGIDKYSPAGKFILANSHKFAKHHLSFEDPFYGLGGLGASSAQYLLAYAALINQPKTKALLETYFNHAFSGQGTAPSGADVLAQFCGKLSYVNKKTLALASNNWPFDDLRFHIIRTNHKLATHEHLKSLHQLDTLSLGYIFKDFKNAIQMHKQNEFCDSINQYQKKLVQMKLMSENTQSLIKDLKSKTAILAAKGCGAMGLDIILLITEQNQQSAIIKHCNEMGLSYIASNEHLTDGLRVHKHEEMVC